MKSHINTVWELEDINLNVTKSNLFKLHLSRKQKFTSNVASIYNSSFESLSVSGGLHIKISECAFLIGSETANPMIHIMESNLIVLESTFAGNRNSSHAEIVKSSASKIKILKTCFEGITAEMGIIIVQKRSQLLLKNSTFFQNGNFSSESGIVLTSYSTASVYHSLFSQNRAATGSSFHVGENCKLSAVGSHFDNNIALVGAAAIYCEPDSFIEINGSVFHSNAVSSPVGITCGETIRCEHNVTMTIHNSEFINNSFVGHDADCQQEPGSMFTVIRAQGNSKATLSTVLFLGNLAVLVGGKYMAVDIDNCEINNNRGTFLSIQKHGNITIRDSVVEQNSGQMLEAKYCRVFMLSSFFQGNSAEVFYKLYFSELTMSNTTFQQNQGEIRLGDFSHASIKNCTFTKHSGGLIRYGNSKIGIKHSTFAYNSLSDQNEALISCSDCNSVENQYVLVISDSVFLKNSGKGAAGLIKSKKLLLQSCNFTGNLLIIAPTLKISSTTTTQMVNCVFERNGLIPTDDNKYGWLATLYSSKHVIDKFTLNDSLFIENTGQMFQSQVYSASNTSFHMANCAFTNNKVPNKGTLINLGDSDKGLVQNCSLLHNDGAVFSVQYHGTLQIENCSISISTQAEENLQIMVITEHSNLSVVHTKIQARNFAVITVSKNSQARFSHSDLQTGMIVDTESSVYFGCNMSVTFSFKWHKFQRQSKTKTQLERSVKQEGEATSWIFVNRSSHLHLTETSVILKFQTVGIHRFFLHSQSGSFIKISESSFVLTATPDYYTFIKAQDSTLNMASSNLSFSRYMQSDLMLLIRSNFSFSDTEVFGSGEMINFRLNVFRIFSSNVTVNNCRFKNIVLYLFQTFESKLDFTAHFLYSTSSNLVSVVDSPCDQQEPNSCLAVSFHTGQQCCNLAVDNSVLRVFPDTELCSFWNDIDVTSLRLFNSTLFVQGLRPQGYGSSFPFRMSMPKLVTWNSTISFGDTEVHSEDANFLLKLNNESAGVSSWCESRGTPVQSLIPDFDNNSHFASGTCLSSGPF